MAFLYNIPKSTDQLSISQGNLLNNNGVLGAIAGNTNPASASINSISGFNWVYLPPQTSTPPAAAAFPSGNIGLYSALYAKTGKNELYINKTTQAATLVQVPATAAYVTATSAPGAGQSIGWTYLPSGVLMVWGYGFTTGSSPYTTTITYASINGFPGFTIGATPSVTRISGSTPNVSSFIYIYNTSLTSFQVYSSQNSNNAYFTWFAIGQ